jgi:hypothetical protein
VINGYRVLGADGSVSPGFHWADDARTDSPYDVLTAEGVRFDQRRRADPAQRMTAAELAEQVRMEVLGTEIAASGNEDERKKRAEQFRALLDEHHPG